jgi:hypothetical protein
MSHFYLIFVKTLYKTQRTGETEILNRGALNLTGSVTAVTKY